METVEVPFFTVITPSYNPDWKLKRAYESLKNNNVKFEHIIVDDCSTGGSYSEGEMNMIMPTANIINLDCNGGAGRARNIALLEVSGEYVIFMDADDYFLDGGLDLIHRSIMTNSYPDFVAFGHILLKDGSRVESEILEENLEKVLGDTLMFDYLLDKVISSPWGKAIKSTIACNEKFPTLKSSEDAIYNLRVLNECQDAIYLRDKLYVFDKTEEGSLTRIAYDSHEFKESLRGWVHFRRAVAKMDLADFSQGIMNSREIRFCVYNCITRLAITPPLRRSRFVEGAIKKIFLRNVFRGFATLRFRGLVLGFVFVCYPSLAIYFVRRSYRFPD